MNLSEQAAKVEVSLKSRADGECIQEVSDQGLNFRSFTVSQRSSDDDIGLSGVAGQPDMERGEHQ